MGLSSSLFKEINACIGVGRYPQQHYIKSINTALLTYSAMKIPSVTLHLNSLVLREDQNLKMLFWIAVL